MPNRILKESICTSASIEGLTWFEEVGFYRLIVSADDYGRFDGRTTILRTRLFPLCRVTGPQVEHMLEALEKANLIQRYEVEGRPYLQIVSWHKHQQIRAQKSRYPAPPTPLGGGNHLQSDAPATVSETESKTKTKSHSSAGFTAGGESERFQIPTQKEVEDFAREEKSSVSAARFFNYYSANGWRVGQCPMADWRAAFRSWDAKEQEKEQEKRAEQGPRSFDEHEFFEAAVKNTYGEAACEEEKA